MEKHLSDKDLKMAMVKDAIRVYYDFCDIEHFKIITCQDISDCLEFHIIFRTLTVITDIYTNVKLGSIYLTVLSMGLNTQA